MIKRTGNACGYEYTVERFDGINEFLQTIEARDISKEYSDNHTAITARSNDYSNTYKGASWYGAKGYEDAREQFMYGTKAKKAMRTAYAATQITRERETVCAPCGCAPIVANALRGIPNSMIDIRRKRKPRVAKIVVNMAISHFVKPSQIVEAGKAIIAAIGKLDAQGIQTEIVCAVDALLNHTQIASYGITIKNAGQAFNAARVSFSLSSPAFVRVFDFVHTSTRGDVVYDSGYGTPVSRALSKKDAAAYYSKIYNADIHFALSEVISRGAGAIDEAIAAWHA